MLKRVGYQSWTPDNLLVESSHNDLVYYTTRWDALCPYIEVNEEMLASVPRPFIVYALPPDSSFGVPINDHYGLVDTKSPAFWADERRRRKFHELDKMFRNFTVTETVIAGSTLTFDDLYEMGGTHFENAFPQMKTIVGQNGYGNGSTSSARKPFIFLVTDGMQNGQNFLNSSRSVVVFLFFMVV